MDRDRPLVEASHELRGIRPYRLPSGASSSSGRSSKLRGTVPLAQTVQLPSDSGRSSPFLPRGTRALGGVRPSSRSLVRLSHGPGRTHRAVVASPKRGTRARGRRDCARVILGRLRCRAASESGGDVLAERSRIILSKVKALRFIDALEQCDQVTVDAATFRRSTVSSPRFKMARSSLCRWNPVCPRLGERT